MDMMGSIEACTGKIAWLEKELAAAKREAQINWLRAEIHSFHGEANPQLDWLCDRLARLQGNDRTLLDMDRPEPYPEVEQ